MEETPLTSDDKALAVVCHLAPLMTWSVMMIGHIAIPLVILLTRGKDSTFVEFHARESLNFQISMTIYWIVTIALMLMLVGFLIAISLGIFWFIVMIVASVKAGSGEEFKYPLCIRFVK